jgi:hypothetical protein
MNTKLMKKNGVDRRRIVGQAYIRNITDEESLYKT